jgi:hypothetical protein
MRFKRHLKSPAALSDSARRADTLKRFNSASALPFGQHDAMLVADMIAKLGSRDAAQPVIELRR